MRFFITMSIVFFGFHANALNITFKQNSDFNSFPEIKDSLKEVLKNCQSEKNKLHTIDEIESQIQKVKTDHPQETVYAVKIKLSFEGFRGYHPARLLIEASFIHIPAQNSSNEASVYIERLACPDYY